MHLRSQIVAVAAALACGIATLVTLQCTYGSLLISRADYYNRYRFADIFVSLKRAPLKGAYLSIDEKQTGQLYTRLKQLPAISSVDIRAVALQSFQDTMARNMRISMVIIIVYASIIAFGMIFNSARIALSERGRELASLHVLGFTRGEIAFVLLGEQVLLTLFAVSVGYLLGYAGCLLISHMANTELFRMPVILTPFSFAYAFVVTTIAAFISALFIYRRIAQLDLIEVLKTRE